jgi:hypothetical protein
LSPVAPSSGHASKALLLAVGAIVAGMVALYGASVLLTNRHNERAQSAPAGGVVSLGTTKHLAKEISDGAQPVFFPDTSGNNLRSVWVQHTGASLDTGWTAFLAQVPGAANDCLWQWNATRRRFDASCDPTRHAPADGSGLETYPVVVADGRLKIDFRSSQTTTSIAGG